MSYEQETVRFDTSNIDTHNQYDPGVIFSLPGKGDIVGKYSCRCSCGKLYEGECKPGETITLKCDCVKEEL